MRTIRRLYFYAVAIISLEVVLWGLIGLLRSIFLPQVIGGNAARLAQALALVLVGVPVFGLHWWVAQRDARRDMDEHASGIRAFFLYAVLMGTLVPIVQNFLSLLNRLLLVAFKLPPTQAMLGPSQSWTDNLIAMLMNAVVVAYFITVLRADWQVVTPRKNLADFRRIYRYLWVIYSLAMMVAAVQQLLRFALDFSSAFQFRLPFVNGLTLALVGTPLWYFSWKTVQDSLVEQVERESTLRLGLLYALSLVGVITVLASGGIVLDVLLRQVLGEKMSWQIFLQRISGPLSIGIPLAGVWAYYGSWLARSLNEVPDAPRRSGLHRLYSYILSAIGLGATFIGLNMLLSFFVDALIGNQSWGGTLRLNLSAALSTLGVGLPLWLINWRPMQTEALSSGDAGDHARRSLVRRIYLYLALFVSVIGGMFSAGRLVYLLLNSLLGGVASGVLSGSLKSLELLALFALMGVYHGRILGKDGKTTGLALTEKHAVFPTLIFDVEGGTFGPAMLAAVQKQSPRLPATVQLVNRLSTKGKASSNAEAGMTPHAVILPADLALDPPEGLRKWLSNFSGIRLVVPRPATGWVWVGSLQTDLNQAALALRQLSEGQEVRPRVPLSGRMVFLYVVAGLFGLEVLGMLFGLVASFLSN